MPVKRCLQCGQPIDFIMEHGRGRWLAVDPQPVSYTPAGGPNTIVTPDGRITYGKVSRSGRMEGYLPHWKTWPHRNWIGKEEV